MKRMLVSVGVAFLFISAADAADMGAPRGPIGMPVKGPLLPPPDNTRSGGYLGLNLGYGWARASATLTTPLGGFVASEGLDGVVGGAQAGWNWQIGNTVYGVEADIQATGQRNAVGGVIGGVPFTVTDSLPWFATARARIGLASGRMLTYVTGGYAYQSFRTSVSSPLAGIAFSDTEGRGGVAVGGGVEWAIGARWSAKLEYLHLTAGSSADTLAPGVTVSTKLRNNIGRMGVNYLF